MFEDISSFSNGKTPQKCCKVANYRSALERNNRNHCVPERTEFRSGTERFLFSKILIPFWNVAISIFKDIAPFWNGIPFWNGAISMFGDIAPFLNGIPFWNGSIFIFEDIGPFLDGIPF